MTSREGTGNGVKIRYTLYTRIQRSGELPHRCCIGVGTDTGTGNPLCISKEFPDVDSSPVPLR